MVECKDLFINNRRYIGSKKRLLEPIQDAILKHFGRKKCKIADLFAGTGIVSDFFANQNYSVIVNDLLYSNFVAYQTWLSSEKIDINKVSTYIKSFNNIKTSKLKDNYFSETYGNKYFARNDAKKIGLIRDIIKEEESSLEKREYFALIASLMYAADKIANTVGHFEHYLSTPPVEKNLNLRIPFIPQRKIKAHLFNEDANQLVRKIKCDVAYIDPPYNARQYINFYHVLENLAKWEKPVEFEGKSMKFKRNHLKSNYSKARAQEFFRDLLSNLNAKLIVVSYNNTYNASSSASNNKISEKALEDLLKEKGKVSINRLKHKFFNAGKTRFNNHKEYLYVCKVRGG